VITQNHGLLGGTLDNTEHLEAGARKLLTASEQTCWRAGEMCRSDRLAEVALATQSGQKNASNN
jgi:hypothetical protein